MKLSVIIPAYNEAECIESAVKETCDVVGIDAEVLVVENGSTDKTAAIVKRITDKRVKLVQLKKASFGGAIREGVRVAKGDYVILLNADWIDVDFIRQSTKLLQKFDIVVGSKVLDKHLDHRPVIRKLLSKLLTFVLHRSFGFNLSDSHGLKAWRSTQNSQWLKTAQNEIIETEFLIRVIHAKAKITEIPVQIEEHRAPRISVFKRGITMLKELRKLYAVKASL